MGIRVLKFGGTSVGTPEARRRAAHRVVSTLEAGQKPVVVVSAPGRKGDPYATDTLLEVLAQVDPETIPEDREVDLLAACGEIFSAVLFSQTLKSMGLRARTLRGGQAGIRTDGVYGNARIVSVYPVSILKAVEQGVVPVICGFQGVYVGPDREPGAELTTLGRGGSDTTAAAVGVAVEAEQIEIYTDVDGIKVADPKLIPQAPTLRTVSYEEVAEMAYWGAGVLHPRAAEIATKNGLPLRVRSTFSDDEGTQVRQTLDSPRSLTGLACRRSLVQVEIDFQTLEPNERTHVERALLRIMGKEGIDPLMFRRARETSFLLDRSSWARLEQIVNGLMLLGGREGDGFLLQCGGRRTRRVESQKEILADRGMRVRVVSMTTFEPCATVTVIGRREGRRLTSFSRMRDSLERAGIGILRTASNDLSMTACILESDLERAMKALYEEFASEIRP